MDNYFQSVSQELLARLDQVRDHIKKHHSTVGALTEEVLRSFLQTYLPKQVKVEQGFIRNVQGVTSKQCDILVYDSAAYAPFYRVNDIVVVPAESVIAVIEVKTTIDSKRFQEALDYFKALKSVALVPCYLFIFRSKSIRLLDGYFNAYKVKHGKYTYDHDTFQLLPEEITGIDHSYHLKHAFVDDGRDNFGYSSFFYTDQQGTVINALQHFYLSVYARVEDYLARNHQIKIIRRRAYYFPTVFDSYAAIPLFKMFCDGAGYTSLSTFTRAFSRMGCTPGELRADEWNLAKIKNQFVQR